MYCTVVMSLVLLAATGSDSKSLINDNRVVASPPASVSFERRVWRREAGAAEGGISGPIPTWNEIIASAIVQEVRQMFRTTSEPDTLRVEHSHWVTILGTLLQLQRDLLYKNKTGNESRRGGLNPKDDVELVPPDVLTARERCAADEVESGGRCVRVSGENPARYLVRVPLQCPEGYRLHRGVCRQVW